jgi:hypothetical protein
MFQLRPLRRHPEARCLGRLWESPLQAIAQATRGAPFRGDACTIMLCWKEHRRALRALDADEGKGLDMSTFSRNVVVFVVGLVVVVPAVALVQDGRVLGDLHERSAAEVAVLSTPVEVVGHGYRLGLPWLPVDRLETVRYAERTWAVPDADQRATVGEIRNVLHREREWRPVRYADATLPGVSGRFTITGLVGLLLGLSAVVVGFVRLARARSDEHDWSTHHDWRIDPPYPDRHGA